jgi:hypothetical protein
MSSTKIAAALAAATLGLSATAALADTAPAGSNSDCFFPTQFRSWYAPTPDVIYIKVNVNDIYRLDLANGGSILLKTANAHLVTMFRGPTVVCSPIDWDLTVSDGPVSHVPVIVKAMTKLTPAEAAALPREVRP